MNPDNFAMLHFASFVKDLIGKDGRTGWIYIASDVFVIWVCNRKRILTSIISFIILLLICLQ
jgi:hypothetical protein